MKILKDKRNIRYEYELDKLKKKKKDNILILNIINNKINYICYILKSDYRNIINDVNYENTNSLETCFYYCKPYISFLLLFYPYIHNYVKCLRNNSLRIYKNFYKYILDLPNNFHSLIFKLRIIDEIKLKNSLNSSNDYDEIKKTCELNTSSNYKNDSVSDLLLLNAYFHDSFTKKNFIKILFSRIYVKKHHRNIFRVLKIILYYFSLPSFSFSKKFFEWYHNKKSNERRNIKISKKKSEINEKRNIKRNSNLESVKKKSNRKKKYKKLYFKIPLFKHVIVPTIYINDYYNNRKKLFKSKFVKIKKKKREETESYLSDNSDNVSSEKSLSFLSDSEEENEVNSFLRKEISCSENEYQNKNSEYRNLSYDEYNKDTKISEVKIQEDNILELSSNISIGKENNENDTQKIFKNYIDDCNNSTFLYKHINENFTDFIKECKNKNKSIKNIEKIYGNYVVKEIQNFFINEKKKSYRKKIYSHDTWKKLINFNDVDYNKNTLIHKACLVANINIIFLLLNLNVKLIIYNDKLELPLHCTLYNCDKYIFLLLLHNTIEYLFFFYLNEYNNKKKYIINGKVTDNNILNNDNRCENAQKKGCFRMKEKEKEDNYFDNEFDKKNVHVIRKLEKNNKNNINNSTKLSNKIRKKKYNKYIKNGFFYNKNINSKFLFSVVKLYISVIIKIIELGNFEFLKILFNYNKYIFCYILQKTEIFYFLCLFAHMYNCVNTFLKFCDNILSFNLFSQNKKKNKKRKNEEIQFLEYKNFVSKKNKKNSEISSSSFLINSYKKRGRFPDENSSYNKDMNEENINDRITNIKQEEEDIPNPVDKDYIIKEKNCHIEEKLLNKYKKTKRTGYINNYVIKKKINKKSRIEIFYSNECAKHIFVPEPTDYPYLRKKVKSNIPENSSRLDVLISNKHGILKLNTFVDFKLRRVQRKATVTDILRVHDISYLKSLLYKMKKYNLTDDVNENFLEETENKKKKNYLINSDDLSEVNNISYENFNKLENHIDSYEATKENTNSIEVLKSNHGDDKKKFTEHDEVDQRETSTGPFYDKTDYEKNIIENVCEKHNDIPVIEEKKYVIEKSDENEMEKKVLVCTNIITKEVQIKNKKCTKEKIDKLILLDNDTFINKHSFNCALNASGVVLNAVDYIYSKKNKNKKVFCVVRPPGHHLGTFGAAQFNLTDEDRAAGSQGFCLLNNIAIGISYAKYKYEKFERIAIIDFDIHHGNGTEQIIRNLGLKKIKVNNYIDIYSWKGWKDKNDKKNIFFSSIHAFDGYFYPGTGFDTIELEPYIINVTLKKNMKAKDFLSLFQNNILIHLFHFKPNLLFLSAGFDGHKLDYVNNGFVKNNTSTYFYLTNLILSLQNKLNFPIISVLEGGYNTSNDMGSVFSLSVLEHLLSFYYNDTSFLSVKKNNKKKSSYLNDVEKKEKWNKINNIKEKKNNYFNKITNINSSNGTECKGNIKKNNNIKNKKKVGTLRFPYVSLGRNKIEEMFKNYFSAFKEKTKETENLNLTKHLEDYENFLKQYDRKQIEIKNKVNNFLIKHKLLLENLLKKKKDFSKIKDIKLPYDSYFYEVLNHFKIKLGKKKKNKNNFLSKNVNQYFSALNNPSDLDHLKLTYTQTYPEASFQFSNLWKMNRN
ncbi:histone deacetylase, putative [Plasmodium relictum]|uniref:histone deacetylase n=1 Tax=Plasmodium relictum TaxID=85471 RepID=A0A1J1HCA0_PLARL|nr:histone deacetylase, putative [Plasmodium relictum]CRH01201.1 histone deacetylase, putative [Plasmodium relictum]